MGDEGVKRETGRRGGVETRMLVREGGKGGAACKCVWLTAVIEGVQMELVWRGCVGV